MIILRLCWHFQSDKNTGHFPFAIDINGDGHDELLVGYNMLDCMVKDYGQCLFKDDHIDEIVPGRFESGPNKGRSFLHVLQEHRDLFSAILMETY